MKKGFTLIELLAVIIILAVVSIIATPIILDVVADSKLSANKSTVYNIIDAGKLYYTESMFDSTKALKVNAVNDIYGDITVSGSKPSGGKLYVNNKGLTALSVIIDGKCYIKEFAGELEVLDNDTCDLGYVGNDSTNPTLSISTSAIKTNDWYKENLYMDILVTDLDSGASSYKYCIDSIECEPSYTVDNYEGSSYITLERINYLCVIGYDLAGNHTERMCEEVKLDKTAPTVISNTNGVEIPEGTDNATINYFAPTYSISGGNINCNPTNTSSLPAGTQVISCTATGNNGLSTSVNGTILITKPYTITNLIVNGSFNNGLDGWSSNATVTVTDNNLVCNSTNSWDGIGQTSSITIDKDDKIYVRIDAKTPNNNCRYGYALYTGGGDVFIAPNLNYDGDKFLQTSNIDMPGQSYTTFYFALYNAGDSGTMYVKDIVAINLTDVFGSGNEPSKEWCDSHIEYFDGTTTIYK